MCTGFTWLVRNGAAIFRMPHSRVGLFCFILRSISRFVSALSVFVFFEPGSCLIFFLVCIITCRVGSAVA